MVSYWIKTPRWLPRLFPRELIWKMPPGPQPAVFLSFDDGPHPEATPFVLDQLKAYGAKATFFCIGKNVAAFPDIYKRILDEGHTAGNHTQHHLNGWKQDNHVYLNDIVKAARYIDSHNFRPPYGRIKQSQARRLSQAKRPWKIYMWDVLSGDFDTSISPEECAENVLEHVEPGSIVVFHDSKKAFPRMRYALPKMLQYCKEKNWEMKAL